MPVCFYVFMIDVLLASHTDFDSTESLWQIHRLRISQFLYLGTLRHFTDIAVQKLKKRCKKHSTQVLAEWMVTGQG